MRVQEAVVECAFVGNTSMRRLQSHLLEVALPVLVLAGIEGGKLFTVGKPFPHLCGEIKVKGNHLTFMCAQLWTELNSCVLGLYRSCILYIQLSCLCGRQCCSCRRLCKMCSFPSVYKERLVSG